MATPWYRTFFCREYWDFAAQEYTAERTAREVQYLLRVLAPLEGRRIADIGCGLGRHAIALADHGASVVGLDASEWALSQASAHTGPQHGTVEWRAVDLLTDSDWFIEPVDAAICIQSFGWVDDWGQLELLRRVRRHLRPAGLLLLDFSNAIQIIRGFVGEASFTLGENTYRLVREYDPLDGRVRGSIAIEGPGQPHDLRHDIRIYTPTEIIQLVREAGFVVERLDSDFTEWAPVTTDTRYAQLLARALPLPPKALALQSYFRAENVRLDLRWSPDEADWLDIAPADIWQDLLKTLSEDRTASIIRRYPVDDPYGSKRAADPLSQYFDIEIPQGAITGAAGVTSILHSLGGIPARSKVLCLGPAYPDVAAWASQHGAQVCEFEGDPYDLEAAVVTERPAVVYVERPDRRGQLPAADAVAALARTAAQTGALIIVDEASANYLGNQASSVPMALRLPGLVVLRGVSKGYASGGLRVGFALAHERTTERLREYLPPLQISELSFQLATGLLNLGDIFGKLRHRVREIKPQIIERFQCMGVQPMGGHPELPWFSARYDRATARALEGAGISGKIYGYAQRRHEGEFVRLAVPLSAERVDAFRRLTEDSC